MMRLFFLILAITAFSGCVKAGESLDAAGNLQFISPAGNIYTGICFRNKLYLESARSLVFTGEPCQREGSAR